MLSMLCAEQMPLVNPRQPLIPNEKQIKAKQQSNLLVLNHQLAIHYTKNHTPYYYLYTEHSLHTTLYL